MGYIVGIHFYNLQSWEDDTLFLSPGLNALIAKNSTGKSVFRKCLEFIVNPKAFNASELDDLIRYNSEYGRIDFYFSDGTACGTFFYRDRIVHYSCDDYEWGGLQYYETFAPKIYTDKLSLLIEPSTRYTPNLVQSKSPALLVDSDSKANFSLIKLLTDIPKLTTLQENLDELIPSYKNRISICKNKLSVYQQILSEIEYYDTDVLEKQINFGETFIPIGRSLAEFLEDIEIACETFNNVKDYAKYIQMVDIFSELNLDDMPILEEHSNVEDYISITSIGDDLFDVFDMISDVTLIDDTAETGDLANLAIDMSSVLEVLPKVDVHKYIDTENVLKLVELVDSLQISFDLINNIQSCINNSLEMKEKIAELELMLDFTGMDGVECPIYGKVVYIDGECFPA